MPEIGEPRAEEFWDPSKIHTAHKLLLNDTKALEFLKKERGLGQDEIIKFNLGLEPKKRAIVIPIHLLTGEIHTVRFHSVYDRHRKWSMTGRTSMVLYSIQHYDQTKPDVYITEGEGDLWTLQKLGLNAISSICGAPSLKFVIEAAIDLFKGKNVFIALDKDDAGLEASARIRDLFGDDTKVYTINWDKELPRGYDISDYIVKDNHTAEDLKKLFIPFSRIDAENIIKQIEAYRSQLPDNPILIKSSEYWKEDKKGNRRLSSFIMKPKERIIDETGTESLKADIVSKEKIIENIILRKDDFNSKAKFLKALPSTEMSFWGSDNDVQLLMEFLGRRNLNERRGTPLIGLHSSMKWVFPGFIINQSGIESNPKLIFLPNGSVLEDELDFIITSEEDFKKIASELFPKLICVNEPHVIFPILGWIFASFLKPLYKQGSGKGFPILNIYGTAEGGKSSTTILFYQLLGFKHKDLFSTKMTPFSATKLMDCTNCFPIIIDEFKSGRDGVSEERLDFWRSIARESYGGLIAPKGTVDLTLKKFVSKAPLAIVGEIALAREKALVERVIPVCPNPIWLNDAQNHEARRFFHELQKMPLSSFVPKYCAWLLNNYHKIIERIPKFSELLKSYLGEQRVSLRIYDNLIIVMMGLEACKLFCEDYGVELAKFEKKKEMAFRCLLDELKQSQIMKRSKMAFDSMLEQIALMAKTGRIKPGVHFETESPKFLFLHFPSCFAEFRKFARETSLQDEVLDSSAYRRQIREIYNNQEYILGADVVKFFKGSGYNRSIKIDLFRAVELRLEVEGFGIEIPEELFQSQTVAEPSQKEQELQDDREFESLLEEF